MLDMTSKGEEPREEPLIYHSANSLLAAAVSGQQTAECSVLTSVGRGVLYGMTVST